VRQGRQELVLCAARRLRRQARGRFEALRRAQFGHVAEDQHHAIELACGIDDGRAAVVDRAFGAVARDQQGVIRQAHRLSGREHLRNGILDPLAALLVDDVEDLAHGRVDGVRRRPSGQLFGDRIHEREPAPAIRGDDRVSDARERHAQQLALPSRLLFRTLAPRDLAAQFTDLLRQRHKARG
jgi:hypothetical protein